MIDTDYFKNNYSTSLEEKTRKSLVGQYWRLIICARWTLTLSILIFLRDYPQLQVITLLVASVLIQILLLSSPPFLPSSKNFMTFFNELATSCYIYILLLLTDYSQKDSHHRSLFGTSIAFLVIFVVGINSVRALPQIFEHFRTLNNLVNQKFKIIRKEK